MLVWLVASCKREQHPSAYQSLYLSINLFPSKLFFFTDFLAPVRATVLKFVYILGMDMYIDRKVHNMTRFILAFLSYCLACEAEMRHMYCFSGVVLVVVVGGGVNFRRVFALRSFSQKLEGLEPWNLGQAYIWRSAAHSYNNTEPWPTFYDSLTL